MDNKHRRDSRDKKRHHDDDRYSSHHRHKSKHTRKSVDKDDHSREDDPRDRKKEHDKFRTNPRETCRETNESNNHLQRRQETKPDNKMPDYTTKSNDNKAQEEIDWESHRRFLDGIFFTDDDVIKRGSQDYHDFWAFLHKYQSFQRKNPPKKTSALDDNKPDLEANEFGIPSRYDKQYRLNISLITEGLDKYLINWDYRSRNKLTRENLSEFKLILLHYFDFLQKQKFARLVKIRRDQQNLPIYHYKQGIVDAIRQHQVVVVAGDTGCGKSTQVPQYLLEAGFTKIACTQPRRIACISLSKRVSFETLQEYGSEVAFQVRFEKSRTKSTKILFLTEGLLLRQIESEPTLQQYDVILIDEVHERHIHTDFLLGVVKCILHQRADLKLVLMSATINIELFSGYFDGAPVCKVPGRLYPIQLQYIPIEKSDKESKSERLDPGPYLRVLQSIDHKYPPSERGDVLIFLSGMSEIMSVVEAAKEYSQKVKSWIVLPLHSTLSIAEQDKVFDYAPEGVRKCIISTNIAETSVTIDGVRFVVDSGKVKEMNYDTKYKMEKLQEFWISRASAEQRKGRAGRTGPGVCFRLYSEADYEAMQEYSTPEIQRVPLESLVLQMVSLGIPDSRVFPFIEPPLKSRIETSISFLKDLGALSEKEQLTSIGEMLAQLPVDVVIGKMLIMASVFDMVDPVLSIAAALCVQSVFTSRAHRDYDASSLRKSLESDHGDPITLLNVFDAWLELKAEGGDTRKWCRKRSLEEQRFYEMMKLKQQFQELLSEHGLLTREEDSAAAGEEHDPVKRRQKHADRRMLGQLRKEQKKISKKRKVLKMEDEDWDFGSGDDDDDEKGNKPIDIESNIKDLEFRLTNDLNQIQEKVDHSRRLTLKDMTMLKVILCSGLFPQVAIADEHNSFKADSEQVFHTKNKGFVLLHPTSVFTTNPEPLQLKEHEVKEVRGASSGTRGQLSNRHQLLAFVSLLETTKPYLIGSLRVPALQTLLLFSNSLDTNADCTRIVCDGWLELRIENSEDAEMMLSAVVKLRTTWLELLKQKLETRGKRQGVDNRLDRRRALHTQKALSRKLAEFLHCDVYYHLRRVHTAEVQHLYRGVGIELEQGHARDALQGILNSGGMPHPYKGGNQVTAYLVYNCLDDGDCGESNMGEYAQCIQRHWTCPDCGLSLIVTTAERLQHEQFCQQRALTSGVEAAIKSADEQVKQNSLDASRKSYHCPTCDKDFKFTTLETLKHKKICAVPVPSG